MLFHFKRGKPKPIATMVMPGRRALGEGWQRVTLYERNDEILMDKQPVDAPAGNRPIYVPAMGNLEVEAVDFLLGAARKRQEDGLRHPSVMQTREYRNWLQGQWMDFIEAKLKAFKGVSKFGPGGHTQRQSPGRTHWTGVQGK